MTTMKCPLVFALVLGLSCPLSISAAGKRRLGPGDRESILDARLDPSFASTPLAKLVFLPFGNELDYQEGAMFISQNFIGEMRQRHPGITIVSPQEAGELIKSASLAEEYRVFLGNYVNTGVATPAFLQKLGKAANVDGIILGQILGFGVLSTKYSMNTGLGAITWNKDKAFVGMELKIVRAKDGRELWWGAHGVQGEKNETVRDLSKVVGRVFATFFGRVPY